MPDNRFHLSLNVQDLGKAVEFYRQLFGCAPTKHYPDYAKFEVSDPPLVLALEPTTQAGAQKLNHFGIRLSGSEGLRDVASRAQNANLEPHYIQGVECCYSRQTKICVNDPDGNLVEFYLVEEDLDHPAPGASKSTSAEAPAPAPETSATWDHLLGSPFPASVPVAEAQVQEAHLRGTFNKPLSSMEKDHILDEMFRILRPGGTLLIHLLVADKVVSKTLPRLPGPAALVEYTPTEAEVLDLVDNHGFTEIFVKRLSHSPVFQFDGAEMRELMLTAIRPPERTRVTGETEVVYKGPFKEITDDFGNTYARGKRTRIPTSTVVALGESVLKDHFVFLNSPVSAVSCVKEPEATMPM